MFKIGDFSRLSRISIKGLRSAYDTEDKTKYVIEIQFPVEKSQE
jgi:hypothetical protein